MCFIVMSQTPVRKLLGAAQNVQRLLDNGTLPAAFGTEADGDSAQLSAIAFDLLASSTAAVANEQKAVSPFLRFRREIMEDSDPGDHLRNLVLSFYIGQPSGLDLGAMFRDLSEYHIRIALELIVAYANAGEDDQHFNALASELHSMGAAA